MRRLELLIDRSRRETENEEFSESTGISTQEFIDYANDAQEDIQSAIARQHQHIFVESFITDSVSGEDTVALPKDILLDNRVTAVYYTHTGRARDYRRLKPSIIAERVFGQQSDPILYIRSNGKLVLYPTPDSSVKGGIRIDYVKRLPKLDTRRAKVSSVTLGPGNTITNLTLDTTSVLEKEELMKYSQLSIVNSDGEQVMRRVKFDDIDTSTGQVIISSGFTFEDGESISVGDWLLTGADTYNVSDLPDTCERFLTAYINWKIFKRDSSNDSAEATEELAALRREIVEIFQDTDDDTKDIPIIDTQFIDDELWEN